MLELNVWLCVLLVLNWFTDSVWVLSPSSLKNSLVELRYPSVWFSFTACLTFIERVLPFFFNFLVHKALALNSFWSPSLLSSLSVEFCNELSPLKVDEIKLSLVLVKIVTAK